MRSISLAALLLVASFAAACGLSSIAPLAEPTAPPTDTPTPAPTLTPTPTLGPREFIDGVFCWPSPIDAGSFNLLRFFGDGTVMDATVAPFPDCQAAWGQMGQYLTLENLQTFNHGEYYLSGETLRFELGQARTNQMMGEVLGQYLGGKMILIKGGATQEYVRVETGN